VEFLKKSRKKLEISETPLMENESKWIERHGISASGNVQAVFRDGFSLS